MFHPSSPRRTDLYRVLLYRDGSMARAPTLRKFAEQHRLQVVTIEQLIAYRKANDGP